MHQAPIKHPSSMQQAHSKYTASTQQARIRHTASTQQELSKHTASTQQARSKHAVSKQKSSSIHDVRKMLGTPKLFHFRTCHVDFYKYLNIFILQNLNNIQIQICYRMNITIFSKYLFMGISVFQPGYHIFTIFQKLA